PSALICVIRGLENDGSFIAKAQSNSGNSGKFPASTQRIVPGSRHFEVAEPDLDAAGYPSTRGFTDDVDHFIVTSKSWRPRSALPNGRPPAYPLLKNSYFTVIDRNGGLW